MGERFPQEVYSHVEFAEQVVFAAMQRLRREVGGVAIQQHEKGVGDIVTSADLAVDRVIGAAYEYSEEVVVASEERRRNLGNAALHIHTDPIDGTRNFAESYEAWLQTSRSGLHGWPTSGAMVSLGAVPAGETEPLWGVLGGPFLPQGPRLYSAVEGGGARYYNLEPDKLYPVRSHTITTPEVNQSYDQALITSPPVAESFGRVVERKTGLQVIEYELITVTNVLSVLQPGFLNRLAPPHVLPPKTQIVAAITLGRNWDVAGVFAIAREAGAQVSGLDGNPRLYTEEDKGRGGIVALTPTIAEGLAGLVYR